MATRGLSLTAPIVALALTGMWSAERLSASDPAEPVFERVLAKSNTVEPPQYRAFRRMEGGINDSEKNGWLEAWTEYTPGRGFTYEIVREGGSDYVREKVLRGMLAGGISVAVPLPRLIGMLNRNGTAYAAGSPLPVRFGTWFFGNGIIPDRWVPSATGQGDGWQLSEQLAPLLEVKPWLSVLTGLGIKVPNKAPHASMVRMVLVWWVSAKGS